MKADQNRDRRFKAEGHLKGRSDSSELRRLSADELIHELRVHQVELEMQNEELRRAHVELEKVRDHYRDLVDSAPLAYYTLNSAGMIADVNPAGVKLLGRDRKTLLGSGFSQFVADSSRGVFLACRTQATETGVLQNFELELVLPDGAGVSVCAALSRVCDPDSGPPLLRMALTDITDRKQAEAELLQHRDHLEELIRARTRELTAAQEQLVLQEKLATVRRVAGSMAHELRNPLGAIRNASYFLQMTAAGELKGKPLHHLQIIDEYVGRANQAITTILDFTQAGPAEPALCDLHSILQQAVTGADVPCNVEVVITIPPGLPQILVDPNQTAVVFRNLLTNAAHAMPGGGTVSIQSRPGQHEVIVDVSDTGTGVKPEHMASLFQPLFTTGEIGVGLGLSICQGFVRANKGTISVVSELGKGTTFTVALPTAVSETPNPKL
jgi:PAS domain S-box-containing protein